MGIGGMGFGALPIIGNSVTFRNLPNLLGWFPDVTLLSIVDKSVTLR